MLYNIFFLLHLCLEQNKFVLTNAHLAIEAGAIMHDPFGQINSRMTQQ